MCKAIQTYSQQVTKEANKGPGVCIRPSNPLTHAFPRSLQQENDVQGRSHLPPFLKRDAMHHSHREQGTSRTIIPDTEFHPRDVPRGTESIEMTDLIIQVAITVGIPGVSTLWSPFSMADKLPPQ